MPCRRHEGLEDPLHTLRQEACLPHPATQNGHFERCGQVIARGLDEHRRSACLFDYTSEISEGLVSGIADRLPRLGAELIADRLIRKAGVHDDDGEVMSDDIMQFVGDPLPLGEGDRLLGLLLRPQPVLEPLLASSPDSEQVANGARDGGNEQRSREVPRPEAGHERRCGRARKQEAPRRRRPEAVWPQCVRRSPLRQPARRGRHLQCRRRRRCTSPPAGRRPRTAATRHTGRTLPWCSGALMCGAQGVAVDASDI